MDKLQTEQCIHINLAPSNSYYEVSIESIGLTMEFLLHGALNDYLGYKEKSENFKNVEHWLFREDAEDLTSFNMCCIVLNQNQDKIRFKIQQLRDMGKTKLSKLELVTFMDMCEKDY